MLVHDMSFVERRSDETKKYLFYLFVGLGARGLADHGGDRAAELARLGARAPRALLRGEGCCGRSQKFSVPELQPIARDLRSLIRELETEYRAAGRQPAAVDAGDAARHPARAT
ncbi:MAG: hypothetical protein MZW92_80430 [Comamonadaceae bacterium]|nr:hypothetical protein [Comamonadaceae bacterium]